MSRRPVITGELERTVERLFLNPDATDVSVGRATGVCRSTVGRWRKRRERKMDPAVLEAEREHAELLVLRRRVKVLEEEREILAKAAAFIDRETGRAR